MEDRAVCTSRTLQTASGEGVDVQLYAVYDGHEGDAACQYLTENLHPRIFSALEPVYRRSDVPDTSEVHDAILGAVSEVDQEFLDLARRLGIDVGSTAVAAILVDTQLTLVNVGNSRALLCAGKPFPRLASSTPTPSP